MRATPPTGPAAWHDVECAAYDADLALWRSLAERHGTPVLDIGAGTGRVALDLASRGFPVVAVDNEPELVEACRARAAERGLDVTARVGDARVLDIDGAFPLALLPMQVAQLMGDDAGREAMLAAAFARLTPAGVLAIALADPWEGVPVEDLLPPLPDLLERDGWVLSSTPVAVRRVEGAVAIDRARSAVSPEGELTEEPATIVLDDVEPGALEAQALAAGYRVLERAVVPPTRDYVGSTVVCLERPA